jgi:hypothetical protein
MKNIGKPSGYWRVKSTRMTNTCMHDHLKTHLPNLPRSHEMEQMYFLSEGNTTPVHGQKRSFGASGFTLGVIPGGPGVIREEIPRWKIRKVGSNLSKRIFRTLLLEFILSKNSAERIVENQHFRNLLEYLDPAVHPFLISRRTWG